VSGHRRQRARHGGCCGALPSEGLNLRNRQNRGGLESRGRLGVHGEARLAQFRTARRVLCDAGTAGWRRTGGAAITRMVGAVMLEQNDEWPLSRRYTHFAGLQTVGGTPSLGCPLWPAEQHGSTPTSQHRAVAGLIGSPGVLYDGPLSRLGREKAASRPPINILAKGRASARPRHWPKRPTAITTDDPPLGRGGPQGVAKLAKRAGDRPQRASTPP